MAEIFNSGKVKKELISLTQIKDLVGMRGKEWLLTSFSTFPAKVCFETQGDEESVVLFLRQHPIVMVPWIILSLFMLTLPSVFGFFPPFAALPLSYQLIVNFGWYVFVFGYTLARFMGWFFNIYIVTDERIVDVDFANIFYRTIATAKIDEIQDINITSSGALETFFGFGSVRIQTAAEIPQFEFIAIPKPDQVGKILNQMIDQEEQEKIEGRVR